MKQRLSRRNLQEQADQVALKEALSNLILVVRLSFN